MITSDSVPTVAWLRKGEVVLPKRLVSEFVESEVEEDD